MIWLLGICLLMNLAAIIIFIVYGNAILGEFQDLPNPTDCKYEHPQHCKFESQPCLYSPGSEREHICALREEDAKNKNEKTFVVPAPRWNDRNPPGE